MVFVGIDIGATWTRIALSDNNGKIIAKKRQRTIISSNKAFIEAIISSIEELSLNIDANVEAIGIGSIGPIDMKKGEIRNPPNIPLKNIPIAKALKRRFRTPVILVNDCTAAVIGEHYFGAAKNIDNVVYITLSSGIGGGAIVDGNVLFGKNGNAVEIGHTVVDWEGKLRCGCGGYGHWEAYTSGKNIGNFVDFLLRTKYRDFVKNSILNNINVSITYEILFSHHKDDGLIRKILMEDVALINAVGFANVINAYDPEIITVGGSIALKNPKEYILDPIKNYVSKFAVNSIPEILLTPLGDDVVLMGSIAVALNRDLIPEDLRPFS